MLRVSALLYPVHGTADRITIGGTSTQPTFNIAATYAGQASIVTLGTVTTGTWNGAAIVNAYIDSMAASKLTGSALPANILTSSLTALGTVTVGAWTADVISTTYTAAKIASVTGTSGRITITGTATAPIFDISATYVGQNTITTLGTVTTGTWGATTVGTPYGGTGLTGYTIGDIIYAANTNALAKLAGNTSATTRRYLSSLGDGVNATAPSWEVVTVDTLPELELTGTLTSALGTITSSTEWLISTAQWNNAAETFVHQMVAIADSASAAGSLLADWQVNAVSMWKLSKGGAVTQAGALTVGSGGINVTGNSTITGTLGGNTTLTATSVGGTLTTASQPNVTTMAGLVTAAALATVGTITSGVWQGTSVSTTYTDAKIKTVTGTSNRITIGGTATDPTFDISTSYAGQATIVTVGTVTTGTWQATQIANAYIATGLDVAKLTVGTTLPSNVVTSSLTTVGTIGAGVWQGTAIVDTYLATISTAGKVSNSATTATSANTASAIVARDGSGNFTAGTITANLTGNISGTAPAGTLTGATLAAGVTASSLTSVGALNSGSITSGFGSIDVGTDSITGGAFSGTGATFAAAGSGATEIVRIRTTATTDTHPILYFEGNRGGVVHEATIRTDSGTGNGSELSFHVDDGSGNLQRVFQVQTSGAVVTGVLTVSSTVTGGTYNGQTISSTASFTGTMAVATSYSLGGVTLATFTSTNNEFYDRSGRIALYLGGSSSNTNYYDNTNHVFRGIGGAGGGNVTVGGTFFGADGTAALPSIRFANAASGLYYPGSDGFGISVAGVSRYAITSAGVHTITGSVGLVALGTTAGVSAYLSCDTVIYYCDAAGASAALTGMKINKVVSTGRSINAAGTVNASGADYAEYVRKASGGDRFAKGDVVHFNDDGEITREFNPRRLSIVKSTNPAYVGGDMWAQHLGERPDEDKPLRDRQIFDAQLEDARQWVDRVAFAGQVPVNVYGAQVGDLIEDTEDGPKPWDIWAVPDVPSWFNRYLRTVGRVIRIRPDGRADVVVTVH
jgi:hypothetical protein